MKGNLPSPRFLHEFDTVDTLALRNISEKRRLRQKLRQLDKQLHYNLVRMETEILSLRLENCEKSSNKLTGKTSSSSKVEEIRSKTLKVPISKSKTKGNVSHKATREDHFNEVSTQGEEFHAKNSITHSQLLPNIVLPKITTSASYVIRNHDELNFKNAELELSSNNTSLETISELDEKKMQAEQRILTSLKRPSFKVRFSTGSRPATPINNNHPLLSPIRQRRLGSNGYLKPLVGDSDYIGKPNRTLSALDVSNLMSERVELFHNKLNQTFPKSKLPGFFAGTEKPVSSSETPPTNIKISVTSENGISQPLHGCNPCLEPVKPRKAERSCDGAKMNNFDDIVRRRLEILKEGVSKIEDFDKVRYLRLNNSDDDADDIKDVFSSLHNN